MLIKNKQTMNCLSLQAADSVKLQIQKAMCERDQANHNTMQIRSDFEKFLLKSNQVKIFNYERIEKTIKSLLSGFNSTSSST